MPRNLVIAVDLDNTLIQSSARFRKEQKIAEKYKLDPELYAQCIRNEFILKNGNGRYSFQHLWPFLRKLKPDLPRKMLHELNALLDHQYFFHDTINFLENFQKKSLILVSSGDYVVQLRKVHAHRIEKYFKNIYVTENKPEVISKIKKTKTFFLDDAPRQIDAVKKRNPDVTCILMRKPPPWEVKTKSELADVHCTNLLDAAAYIKSRM